MTPETPVPTWKRQARALVHDAILDAARATFAEHGYTNATVDEIAARAEVSKGTIYNYVDGGKAGLFVAVLAEHFDELHALAEAHLGPAAAPFRDRYHAFVAAVAAYFQGNADLLRVHLREVPQLLVSDDDGSQATLLREQRDRIVGAIAAPLGAAVAAGDLRAVPVQPTAHVLFGVLMGVFHQTSAVCAAGLGPQETADFLTALLFDGLCPEAVSPAV